MKPVSLKEDFSAAPCCPQPTSDAGYPTVWLHDLGSLVLPEEGEITFSFKRERLEGVLGKEGGKLSASLCLKEILNVKEVEVEEPEKDERAEEAVEKLFEALSESDLLVDESEDDNPSKY